MLGNPMLVQDFLSRAARRLPDKTALVCEDRRYSYAEIDAASERIAAYLKETGIRYQDRVLIFLDNSPESVIAFYGVLKAGGIFVMLSSGMKAPKLQYIIKDVDARAIITHKSKLAVVHKALEAGATGMHLCCCGLEKDAAPPAPPGDGTRVLSSVNWDALLDPAEPPAKVPHPGTIDVDIAMIVYTSGSTGEPKGVVCPHRNMVSVTRSIVQYLENTEDDVVLSTLPLSFGYGLYQVLASVMCGGTVVLERSFLYPAKVIERMVREKATGFPLVPTMAAILLQMEQIQGLDFSSLRYLTNAAAALPEAHVKKLMTLFPNAKIYSMYGQTECVRGTYLRPEDIVTRPSSVGGAIPNEQLFVHDADGNEVAPGEVGELVVRGSNVMRGYWNSPEETARKFRPGRYFGETLLYTGDLFRKDEEGYLYFVCRKDDLIKTKGERVSPKEIEHALCEMDGVSEAAVVGVPHEVFGQMIKAYIVARPGAALEERQILAFCRNRLEPFMLPGAIEFRPELPKTPNGKIDKKQLR